MSGTVSYREYITTDEWKQRRCAALLRSVRRDDRYVRAPRCEVCGRTGTAYKNPRSTLDSREHPYRVDGANGLNVHHLHYRTLGNEQPEDLIVLCTDVAIWVQSGYRGFSSRVGCHERVHDDPAFRREVERIARSRLQ